MARFPLLTHVAACVAAALLCSACSHQMTLVNARVSPPALTAQFGSRPARYFVDRVKFPVLEQHRIGKRRTLSGNFASWITTDSDLPTWSHKELQSFLVRHRQTIVPRISDADFIFQCEITSISVTKKYDAIWNDDFSAHIEFSVLVREVAAKPTAKTAAAPAKTATVNAAAQAAATNAAARVAAKMAARTTATNTAARAAAKAAITNAVAQAAARSAAKAAANAPPASTIFGRPVCAQKLTGDYFVERPYEDNGTISDDEMCNRCLSMAFQKALEQIVIRDTRTPKPSAAFPALKPF